MYKIKILPKANLEIRSTLDWYGSIYEELKVSIIFEIKSKLSFLESNPEIYQIISDKIRKASLKVFPYSIYFKIDELKKEVLVFRFRHNKQKSVNKKVEEFHISQVPEAEKEMREGKVARGNLKEL